MEVAEAFKIRLRVPSTVAMDKAYIAKQYLVNRKNDIPMGDGDKLKAIRVAKQLNQPDFANILKISQGHISDMERNLKKITKRTKGDINREFRVNPAYWDDDAAPMFLPLSEVSGGNDTAKKHGLVVEYEKADIFTPVYIADALALYTRVQALRKLPTSGIETLVELINERYERLVEEKNSGTPEALPANHAGQGEKGE